MSAAGIPDLRERGPGEEALDFARIDRQCWAASGALCQGARRRSKGVGVPTLTGFQVPSGTSSTETESPLEDNSMLCVCVCVRVSISVRVYRYSACICVCESLVF